MNVNDEKRLTEASTFLNLLDGPSVSSTTLSSSVKSPRASTTTSSTVPAVTPSLGLYSTCNNVFPTSNGIPIAVVRNSDANSCAMSENVRDSSGSVGSISTPARVEVRPLPSEEGVVGALVGKPVEVLGCWPLPVGGRKSHSSCGGAVQRSVSREGHARETYCIGSGRKPVRDLFQPSWMYVWKMFWMSRRSIPRQSHPHKLANRQRRW